MTLSTAVLEALGEPTRRAIVSELARGPRAASEVARLFPISQPAVSRHLRVLRESGLVEPVTHPADGRVRVYRLRPEPLEELAGWLAELRGFWQGQLDAFRDHADAQR